jgi:response regulator NasT
MAMSRHAQIIGLEAEVTDLNGRLAARKLLDRAKALLQAEYGMTEAAAFRFVQRTSMNRRTTMSAVAEAIVNGGIRPEG